MLIHQDFTGGNIRVKTIQDTKIYLENELRDSTFDWFYWAFCIEGAEGKTLTFHFNKDRIGYYGPAISHDLKSWGPHPNPSRERAKGSPPLYGNGLKIVNIIFIHNLIAT